MAEDSRLSFTVVAHDKASRVFSKIGDAAKTVGSSLAKIGMAGAATAALGGAIPSVLGLASALSSVAGAAIALPALALGAATAFGTLKVATMGVGAALSAAAEGDAEAFAAALEKLSPAARTFATAIRDVFPQLTRLQQIAQERFFSFFADDIKGLATNLLPQLEIGMFHVAGAFGHGVGQVTNFLKSAQASKDVNQIMRWLADAAWQAQEALGPVARAFLDIAAVGGPSLSMLGGSVSDVANKFANWAKEARESGALQGIFDTALRTLSELAGVARNVGRIFGDIFANAPVGTGIFANLERLTATLQEFTSSDAGQKAITDFFGALGQISGSLAQVIPGVVTAIATLAPAIGTVAQAMAPTLGVALSALASGISELAPAAGPVGLALSQIMKAVTPLLPLLGQLAGTVLTVVATQLSTLAQAATPVVAILASGLSGILAQLGPLLIGVAQAIQPFIIALGGALATALAAIMPPLFQLAKVFVDSLLPELPRLTAAFMQLVPPITEAATIFGTTLADALVELAPMIPDLAVAMIDMAVAVVGISASVMPLLPLLAKLAGWLIGQVQGGMWITTNAVKILAGVFNMLGGVVGWVVARILDIPKGARAVGSFFTSTIPGWINTAVRFFQELPGRIVGALGDLGSRLYSSGRSMIQGFINGIKDMVGNATSAAGDLVGSVRDLFPFSPAKKGPFSGTGYTSYSGQALIKDWAAGMSRAASSASSTAAGVVGSVAGQFTGGLGVPALAGMPSAGVTGSGSGGGNTYQVTVNVPMTANPGEVGREVVSAIQEYERRNGNSWRR